MHNDAFIAIGSNLRDPLSNCRNAVDKINNIKNTKVSAVSSWYSSKALTLKKGDQQPDYINGAVKISTKLSAENLLKELKNIEKEMGRNPDHKKWSARIIDLDIIIYDKERTNKKRLTIPHPEALKRVFVLKPLCDIEPELIIPPAKESVCQIVNSMKCSDLKEIS